MSGAGYRFHWGVFLDRYFQGVGKKYGQPCTKFLSLHMRKLRTVPAPKCWTAITPRNRDWQILRFWAFNLGGFLQTEGWGQPQGRTDTHQFASGIFTHFQDLFTSSWKTSLPPWGLGSVTRSGSEKCHFNLQNSPLNPALRFGLAVVWGWARLGLSQRQTSCTRESGIFPSDKTGVFFQVPKSESGADPAAWSSGHPPARAQSRSQAGPHGRRWSGQDGQHEDTEEQGRQEVECCGHSLQRGWGCCWRIKRGLEQRNQWLNHSSPWGNHPSVPPPGIVFTCPNTKLSLGLGTGVASNFLPPKPLWFCL